MATTYSYTARSMTGNEVTGLHVGENVDEVVSYLHSRDLAVLKVETDKRRGETALPDWFNITIGSQASTRDLAVFSRQLATVLESGIPLIKGLRGLVADSGGKALSAAVQDVSQRLERGESLSEAMAAHPAIFNTMYLSMIRAGERSGTLDRIVIELAEYLEKTDAIRTKVRSAMSYPLFIMGFAVLASIFLVVKIVPTFSKTYAELGQDLPGLTRVVLGISDAIRGHWLLSLLLIAVLAAGAVFSLRSHRGARLKDVAVLKVPIFGPIITKSVMSRFARTFGILQGSGLPLLESLDLVGRSSGNLVVAEACETVKERVSSGYGITDSFRSTGVFPEMVLQMMSTGEESGDLDGMLLKVSDFYDRQVEAAVHSISSLLEPVMIVFVGLLIGFIVVSMFLPMFQMGEALMQGGAAF